MASTTTIQQKIASKMEELRQLQQMETLSVQMLQFIEDLTTEMRTMSDNTTSVSRVLGNWQRIMADMSALSTAQSRADYVQLPVDSASTTTK